VLGAMKSATSSLALDLMHSGILSAAGHEKEFHFFDDYEGNGSRDQWLEQMPTCPKRHSVLADFTPKNLRLVAPSAAATVDMSPWWQDFSFPHKMLDFYGEKVTSVTFVAMLRGPLARFQSHFYQLQDLYAGSDCKCKGMRCRLCRMVTAMNFSQAVDKSVQDYDKNGRYNDFLWAGMYGQQLEAFFKEMDPAQFVIVPMKVYVTHPAAVCKAVTSRLKGKFKCRGRSTAHRNIHEHPPLEEDVSPSTLRRYDDFMRSDSKRLVKALVGAHTANATLVHYPGHRGSKKAVHTWLERNW